MKNKKAMQKYATIAFSIFILIFATFFASAKIIEGDDYYDTDGGFMIYTKGTCYGASGGGTDYCISGSSLKEYELVGSNCYSQTTSCTYGCSNGECLSTPTVTVVDSDGGDLPRTPGVCQRTVGTSTTNYYDTWNSFLGRLTEYYKSGTSCLPKYYYCTGATYLNGMYYCYGAVDTDGDAPMTPGECSYGGTTYKDSREAGAYLVEKVARPTGCGSVTYLCKNSVTNYVVTPAIDGENRAYCPSGTYAALIV